MKSKLGIICILIVSFWAVVAGEDARAQTAPATNHQVRVGKTRLVGEFIGTLTAVDKKSQMVAIASGTPAKAISEKAGWFLVTGDTKFFKGDAPASLEDAVIGQEIRYGFRIGREGGTNQLTVLRFVPKNATDPNK